MTFAKARIGTPRRSKTMPEPRPIVGVDQDEELERFREPDSGHLPRRSVRVEQALVIERASEAGESGALRSHEQMFPRREAGD
jgi:hypothetical protein